MSSSSSSGLSDPIRIGNFFSSFDYQSVIDKLTYARQGPIRQLDDKESKLASQKTAVNQIITRFSALLSRANSLTLATSASGKNATVSGPGVTASATPSATPGSFTVNVAQLATGTTATGTPLTGAVDAASKLNAANFGTSVTAGTFTIKAASGASKTYTVDPAAQSLNDIIALINADTGTSGITASIQNDANGLPNILQLDSTMGAIQAGIGGDTSNFLDAVHLAASPGTTTRASTASIARINLSATMSSASFNGGPPAAGAHFFKINGVQIDYDPSKDSLGTVLARINTSTAGVSATYDPVADTIKLTQTKLGSTPITFAEDGAGGDFLTKVGLLNASQTLGQNAQYSINGGPTQYATTNAVSTGNGVSLTLTATTASPVTVTVSQDTSGASSAIQNFVTDFNSLYSALGDLTKSDKDNPGPLSGDSAMIALQSTLRSIIGGIGTNVTSKFQSLASIGVSFGAVGTAVGQANTLVFDSSAFTKAMQDDPVSVQNLLSQLTLGANLNPGGTSSVTGLSGTPAGTKAGSYQIIDDGAGNLTSVFTPSDGSAQVTTTATVTANSTNTTLVPGVTLNIGALQGGSSTIAITKQSASVFQSLADFLNGQVGTNGTLSKRLDTFTTITKDIDDRKAKIQASIDAEMTLLRNKFIAMEQAQAAAQSASSALASALAKTQSN